MDSFKESTDLLQEKIIISEEEKEDIINSLNEDLLTYNQKPFDIKDITAGANGLLSSFLIALSVMVITAILLILANLYLSNLNETSQYGKRNDIPETEWGILNLYVEESTKKLDGKNEEIEVYKGEIIVYDQKLESLRKLLKTKEDIEKRLLLERKTLLNKGVSEEDISSRIQNLEDSLIEDLSPELITLFDTNINEINKEIETILNEKSKSIKELEQSIVEKEILLTEKNLLEIEGKNRLAQENEILETVKEINETTKNEEINIKFLQKVSNYYRQMYVSLDQGKSDSALETLQDLSLLLNEELPNAALKAVVNFHIENINYLEKLIKKNKENLNSFSINQGIKEVETPFTPIEKQNDATLISSKYTNVGSIKLINFNSLIINANGLGDLTSETNFFIFKFDDTILKREIAKGTISNISGNLIYGKLQSLSSSELKVQKGDLVYVINQP